MGLELADLRWMQQVHGADVGRVDDATPPGAEIPRVDALVTDRSGTALTVQVADCVPVLFASVAGPIGVAHAGRAGVVADVVGASLAALADLAAPVDTVHAVVGPAIGGCCYEVPATLRDEVAATHPVAAGETTWGTPSLDLPAAVVARLQSAGVASVQPVGACTRCDDRATWFSHRVDPSTGRQLGVITRRRTAGDTEHA